MTIVALELVLGLLTITYYSYYRKRDSIQLTRECVLNMEATRSRTAKGHRQFRLLSRLFLSLNSFVKFVHVYTSNCIQRLASCCMLSEQLNR